LETSDSVAAPAWQVPFAQTVKVLTEQETDLRNMQLAGTSAVDTSFRQNLQQVNDFIADCERRVNAAPQDELAREYLSSAYQQKAELLSAMMAALRPYVNWIALRSDMKRSMLPVLVGAVFLCSGASAAGQHFEKHFAVHNRPVVVIHNVANGRIEVKSWKNAEVDVLASQASDKILFDMEQAGDRIAVTANIRDASAQPRELDTSLCPKKRNCSSRRRRDLFTSSRSWAI
jgi:hypothetical protein